MVNAFNERFRRSPLTAYWDRDGHLADAGVLIHVFDGLEASERWKPTTAGQAAKEQSASLVFQQQHVPGESIPLMKGGGGIIFIVSHFEGGH